MKTHSAPYVPVSKTREQIAEWIAAGFPAANTYQAVRLVKGADGNVRPVMATPVHLRRS